MPSTTIAGTGVPGAAKAEDILELCVFSGSENTSP